MNRDKVLSMIGLAKRAGKVSAGAFLAEKAVQSGKSVMVVAACDAADNVKKKFRNLCSFYATEYLEYADKASLGQYTGHESTAVVSINDQSFAAAVISKHHSMGDASAKET